MPAAFRSNFQEISLRYPKGFSQINFVEGNILSNQTNFAVSSWDPRLWNRFLNQEQKNMAYINGFKNSVENSLLYWENETIYFWIWARKIKDKNSGHILRTIIFYIVYYLTHTAWGVMLSSMDFFGKCEQICNLLRVAYMIILAKRNPRGVEGRDFVSCAVPGIIPGDALVLVIKRTVEHRSELILFRCFHFRLDKTNHL